MGFNRSELLTRVEHTRQRIIAATLDENVKEIEEWDEAAGLWLRERGPQLREMLVTAIAKLDRGEPLLHDDVRLTDGYSLGTLTFRRNRRPTELSLADVRMPTWLVELDRVLTAVNDPEVSSHMLEKAGVIGHLKKLSRS